MNYPSIRIEGAILSPDILDRLDDAPGQRPAEFGLDTGTKVRYCYLSGTTYPSKR